MTTLRIVCNGFDKFGNFVFGIRMLENRQAKGCFGDKCIAGNQFKGLGRTFSFGFVIAGGNYALAFILD